MGRSVRWRRLESRRAAKNGRPTRCCVRRFDEYRREVTDQNYPLWEAVWPRMAAPRWFLDTLRVYSFPPCAFRFETVYATFLELR